MKNEGRILLDIRGLLMRSLHSGTDAEAATGEDGKSYNRAEYGMDNFFSKYLGPILEGTPPRLIIACWDTGNRYRRARYPDYKKHRRDKEIDKVQQTQYDRLFKMAEELLKSLGAIQAKVPNTEADDLIALLVQKLDCPTMVYTVDGDLSQLSSENCTVVVGDEVIGSEYKGVPTNLVRLHKSIVGDSSDGYPGIKGMGQKAWEKLVENYGLDGMEELDEIAQSGDKSGLKEALEGAPGDKLLSKMMEFWNEWRLSHDLATLHPFEADRGLVSGRTLQKIEWTKRLPDKDRALAALNDADCDEFGEVINRYLPTQKLITRDRMVDVSEWLSHVGAGGLVAFDYETWDPLNHEVFRQVSSRGKYVDVISSKVTGASFCAGDNYQHTIYVSVDHADTDNCDLETIKDIIEKSQDIHGKLVVQNAMFEMPVTRSNIGKDVMNAPIDTKIMASYVDENQPSGLKESSLHYLRYKQTSYDEVTQGKAMNEISGAKVMQYGCDDAFVTAHLADLYYVIMQVEGSWRFFEQNEIENIWPILESYEAGQRIDYSLMQELQAKDAEVSESGMKRIRTLLSEHCREESQERANNLLDADLKNIRDLATEQGKGADFTDGKVEKFKSKALAGSKYRPLVIQRKEAKFTATPKQVSEVAKALGITEEVSSLAPNKVNEWRAAIKEILPQAGDRAREFANLLSGAAHEIRKREGENYEKFFEFCLGVKSENAPMETFGDELNFDSPDQMQHLFYCKLGLPVRTRSLPNKGSARDTLKLKGSPSTNEQAVLRALAEDVKEGDWRFEVLKLYLAVKEALTRDKFYYRPYPMWLHPKTGRVHPSVKNCGTVTRRPTASSPNILQVAKGPVRGIFIPDQDDHVIVSIDFNGQELRIMGSEAKDPVFIDAYCGEVRKDIHCVTGAGIAPIEMRLKLNRADLVEKYAKSEAGKLAIPYEVFERLAKEDKDHEDHKVFNGIREDAKPVNFLISYLGSAPTLAERMMVPTQTAQAFIDGFFQTYPRIGPWQEEVKEFAQEHGYTQTAYGNRRHLSKEIYSKDNSLKSRQERQAVNHIIQGCLQAGSRVDTKSGLVPIEDLVGKEVEVWTGFRWAKAVGLNRGPCELAEITLSSGLVVNCDIRHKLKNGSREWVEFGDLKEGDLVSLPKTSAELPKSCEMGWPFVLGFWLGDGWFGERECSLKSGKGTYTRRQLHLVGGETKKEDLKEICTFLEGEGLHPVWSVRTRGRKTPLYLVSIYRKKDCFRLEDEGFVTGSTALTKEVPAKVWSMTQQDRVRFLLGYAMSDGSRNMKNPSWHTPNVRLLREIQVLLSSVGVDSTLARTGFGWKLTSRGGVGTRKYPEEVLARDFQRFDVEVKSASGDCQSIVNRRVWKNGGDCYQHVAERMYEEYMPGEGEVYRYDRIESVERLGVVEDTYTLSVDDPLHQFVADGVVHKNTAADILKIVLRAAAEKKVFYETGSRLVAPVYDEIVASVPGRAVYEYITRMSEIMALTPPGHAIPMVPEASIGATWYPQIELGSSPNKDAVEQAVEKSIYSRKEAA